MNLILVLLVFAIFSAMAIVGFIIEHEEKRKEREFNNKYPAHCLMGGK